MTVRMCTNNFKINMELLVTFAMTFMKSAQNVWLTNISYLYVILDVKLYGKLVRY